MPIEQIRSCRQHTLLWVGQTEHPGEAAEGEHSGSLPKALLLCRDSCVELEDNLSRTAVPGAQGLNVSHSAVEHNIAAAQSPVML